MKRSNRSETLLEGLRRDALRGIKEGRWPRWSERALRAQVDDAAKRRAHGYPTTWSDLRANQLLVAAWDAYDRTHPRPANARTIPSMFTVPGAPSSDVLACGFCSLAKCDHTGDLCGLCRRPVEHHERPQANGATPIVFAECLAGRARMARARQAAGVELDRLDELTLAETQHHTHGAVA